MTSSGQRVESLEGVSKKASKAVERQEVFLTRLGLLEDPKMVHCATKISK